MSLMLGADEKGLFGAPTWEAGVRYCGSFAKWKQCHRHMLAPLARTFEE